MLSKKNAKLMIQKQQPRKQRFGIRKLSIGVVSVLLGLLIIGGGHDALADNQPATGVPAVADVVSSAPASEQAVASNEPVSTAEVNDASSVDSVADGAVMTASAVDSTVENTPAPAEIPAIDPAAPSAQPTAPVVSAVPESTPAASEQPMDSAAPELQVPVVSAVPVVDNEVSGSTVVEEPTQATTGDEVMTPPLADQSVSREVSADGVQIVDKIHTDQILKDKYGIDVNHLDAKSVLMLASLFHIFANEANLGADVNGNLAVGILNSNVDFGTRGDSIHLSKGDIYYIQQLNTGLQSGSFRNELFNHVVFGKDVNVEIIYGRVYVNGHHMVNLKPEEVFKDGAGTNYVDFPAVFQRLLKAADFYASQEESAGIIKDFSDMNNRFVDVSQATPKDNVIYVNIPFEYLNASQPVKIYGLSSKVDGPTVVINVIGMPAGSELAIHTQVKLYYDDEKNNHVNPSESHEHPNHVLWNFGGSTADIVIQSGHFMGSILAPNATVTANVNVDGNIIANIVNIKGGESHKWDIHPVEPPSFIEIPEQPTDPQPTDPEQPTQPTEPEQPTQPTEPEQPTQPTEPEQPTQPTEPDQPTQPTEPEQPTQPTDPDQPTQPTEPEQPTQPTDPDQPTQPTEPEQPTQPTEPDQPTDPEQPTQPTDPDQPTQPTEPEQPTQPTEPDQPTEPEQPTQPTEPEQPTQPTEPDQPTQPTEPEQPTQPTEPEQPTQPTEPEQPTQPTEPEQPTQPTEPEQPTQPTEPEQPTQPTEPEQPTQPTEPEQPTQPTDPEQPTQPTEPEQPTQPTEPEQPTQPTEPGQPTQPIEPEQPTQPTDPEQPTQPTEPEQPTQPTDPEQPTQPTQPTEPEQPTQPTEPEQPTQPTDPEQPTQPTEPSQPTQPTEPEQPVTPITETEPIGTTDEVKSASPSIAIPVSATGTVSTPSQATPAANEAKGEEEAVALPQTGTDSHGILLGIALAIAAQLMIWGLVQPKKKK